MFSQRFALAVVLTAHARERMAVRDINEALLLDIIETGVDKNAGAGPHWIFKHYPDQQDNLLCVAAVVDDVLVVKTVNAPMGDFAMKSVYFEDDDIQQIRVSDKPITRETSHGWNTNMSYAEDGSVVEIVPLDAKKQGLLPVKFTKAA